MPSRTDNANELIRTGRLHMQQGRLSAAEDALRRAAALAPESADAAYELACLWQIQWRSAHAKEGYENTVRLDPRHRRGWHNLMMISLYDPDESEASILARSRTWAQHFFPQPPGPDPNAQQRVPAGNNERLRIGYLSPDFTKHACSCFLTPLIAAHDRSRFELFAYACVETPDTGTDWFRSEFDHWRDISNLDDAAVAQAVRRDGIDILVDLAGHTRGGRLGVFGLKPAPVQLSWLGYPATVGLSQIDYRVTDMIADPPGIADDHHAEELIRLDNGFLCYEPRFEMPPVGSLPAQSKGFVTFGSFNNLLKVTPQVVATWARIMHAVPRSCLVLKGMILNYAETRARVAAAFARHGIGADRLALVGWLEAGDALKIYNDIDIGLDTFPYNGTTTTFEALGMGVPVVTLRGERHAARVGASLLTHLGRSEWIAGSIEEYTALAIQLANDRARLAGIRPNLRDELKRSSLCDRQTFARQMESAYKRMYTKCRSMVN